MINLGAEKSRFVLSITIQINIEPCMEKVSNVFLCDVDNS